MKRKHLKLIGSMILIGAMVCVLTYAGRHRETSLPAAVEAAIKALYPQAVIEEVQVEQEGLKVYEVELEQNRQDVEVTVAPDGTIVEVETELAMEDLPPAVAAAITQAAEGARIKEVIEEVTYAVVKLVKLDRPQTSYEAELIRDGKISEIEVAADGTILEQGDNGEDNDDKCAEDDDDDDDEDDEDDED